MDSLQVFARVLFKGVVFSILTSIAIGALFALFFAIEGMTTLGFARLPSILFGSLGTGAFTCPFTIIPIFLAHFALYATRQTGKKVFTLISVFVSAAAATLTVWMVSPESLAQIFRLDSNVWNLLEFAIAAVALMTFLSVKLIWRDHDDHASPFPNA